MILPVDLFHPARFQLLNVSVFDAMREGATDENACIQIDIKENKMSIWTILFAVLLIAWLGGLTVFHVAGGLIHLLLVFALISLVLHFVMGTRTA